MHFTDVSIGISPGSIEVAQRNRCHPIRGAIVGQDALDHRLARPVWIGGVLRMLFGQGHDLWISIGCARTGKDDATNPMPAHGLKQRDRPHDVVAVVSARIAHGLANVGIGGKVHDTIRLKFFKNMIECQRIENVAEDERTPPNEILVSAR